jgi:hypothetical protein
MYCGRQSHRIATARATKRPMRFRPDDDSVTMRRPCKNYATISLLAEAY